MQVQCGRTLFFVFRLVQYMAFIMLSLTRLARKLWNEAQEELSHSFVFSWSDMKWIIKQNTWIYVLKGKISPCLWLNVQCILKQRYQTPFMLFRAAVLIKILINAERFIGQILFSWFYCYSLFWLQCLKKPQPKLSCYGRRMELAAGVPWFSN